MTVQMYLNFYVHVYFMFVYIYLYIYVYIICTNDHLSHQLHAYPGSPGNVFAYTKVKWSSLLLDSMHPAA